MRRRLMVGLALLAGVPVAVGVLATTPPAERWLAGFAQSQVAALLAPGWTVDTPEVTWGWGGRVRLGNVVLRDPEGRTAISVRNLDLDLGLPELPWQRIHLRSVRLDGVDVRLRSDADGVLDLLRAFGGPWPADPNAEGWGGLPVGIVVHDLGARDVRVWLSARDAAGVETSSVGLQVLALRGAVELPKAEPNVRISGLGLEAVLLRPGPAGLRLEGDATYTGDGITLEALVAQVLGSRIRADAVVSELGGDALVKAEVQLDALDLGTIRDLLGAGIAGRFEGKVTAEGRLSALALQADLAGVDGTSGRAVLGAGSVVCLPVGIASATDPCGGPEAVGVDAPLRWRAALDLQAVSVEQIAPSIGGPLRLEGVITARGGGTAWPEELFVADGRWDGAELDVWGLRVRKVGADVGLRGGVLQFGNLDLAGVAGTVTGDGTLDLVGGTLDLDLAGDLVPSMLEDFGVTQLGGRGSYRGRVYGNIYAEGVPIDVALRARMAPLTWGSQVRLGAVEGPLRVRVRGGVVDVEADLLADELSAYGATASAISVPDLTVHVNGPDVTVRGTASGPLLRYGEGVGIEEPVARFVVRVPPEGETTVEADLEVGAQDLYGLLGTHGTGTVRLVGSELALGLDLRWEDTPFLVTEGFTFDLQRQELALASLDFRPSARQRWTLEGPARLRLVEGGVADADVHLRSDLGGFDVEGRIATRGPLAGRVAARDLDLEALAEMLPDLFPGLDGVVNAEIKLSGRAEDPVIDGGIGVSRLYLEERVRFLDLEGSFGVRDGQVAMDLLSRVGGREWFAVRGTLPVVANLAAPGLDPSGRTDLRLVLAAGDLARFEQAVPGLDVPEGRASGVFRMSGVLRDPQLDLDLVAEVEQEGVDPWLRAEVDVSRAGNELVAHVDLYEGLRPLLVTDGRADTRLGEIVDWIASKGPRPDFTDPSLFADAMDVTATITGVPIETLRDLAGVTADVNGALEGTIHISGSPRRPTLEAHLSTDAVAANTPTPVELDIVPEGDAYRLLAVIGDPADPWLTLGGRVPLSIDTTKGPSGWGLGDWQLQASGKGIPLSTLQAIDPSLEVIGGDLVVSGGVMGQLNDPSPDLTFDLRDASFRYRPLGLLVRRASGLLHTRAEGPGRIRVEVESLEAQTRPLQASVEGLAALGDSAVSVEGWVVLQDLAPAEADARVNLRSAWLSATAEQQLRASGEVTARGVWPDLRVRGGVQVDQGRVLLNTGDLMQDRASQLDESITVHRKGAGTREVRVETVGVVKSFDVDVDIDLGRNLNLGLKVPIFEDLGSLGAEVTRADIAARLGGQLDFGMQQGVVSVVGELEALEGRVEVLSGKFDLTDGSRITFLGRDYTNPILEIAGAMPVGGGEVRLKLGGTALAPTFDFSSDDFGSDAAILTILLTGEAPEDLSASQGESALKVVGDLLLSGVIGGVSLGSMSVEADGTVRVGLPLYRTLFVESMVRPTARLQENTVTVEAEWSILPRLVLDARYGDRRVSGELAYELRFSTACDQVRDRWAAVVGRATAEETGCREARRALKSAPEAPAGTEAEGPSLLVSEPGLTPESAPAPEPEPEPEPAP